MLPPLTNKHQPILIPKAIVHHKQILLDSDMFTQVLVLWDNLTPEEASPIKQL